MYGSSYLKAGGMSRFLASLVLGTWSLDGQHQYVFVEEMKGRVDQVFNFLGVVLIVLRM